MLKRRSELVGLTGACLGGALTTAPNSQTVRSEAALHPRIAKAIEGLEDVIRYIEAAPHDFGGHKVKAIADSRAAILRNCAWVSLTGPKRIADKPKSLLGARAAGCAGIFSAIRSRALQTD